MSDHAQDLLQLLTDSATSKTLLKAVFSSARAAEPEFLRVSVRPVEVRGLSMLQFTSQTATQEFHKNFGGDEALAELTRLVTKVYRNARITTADAIFEARTSRKGKCFLRKEAAPVAVVTPPAAHNRTRNYLIPEGVPCPFLIHTGVMTKDGAVRAAHSKKFGQINRFLEFINDVVAMLPADRTIHVVDFGCGKSYLTFATQYLLTTLLQRDCRITGLDRRADVVQTCSKIAKELQLPNLQFAIGDIAGFESDNPVDLVISLHACDTATDDALAQAVRWKSRVILAVPCCQHELNELLTNSSLPPISSYGLLKERFAAMTTDAMRGTLLTAAGYQTQILEFIDMEHTPKNLLIRSVRRTEKAPKDSTEKAYEEVFRLRNQLNIPPLTLERRLLEQESLPSLCRPESSDAGLPVTQTASVGGISSGSEMSS